MFRIDATRRGAVLLFFLLLVGVAVADTETKNINVNAEIIGDSVLRIQVEGHAYYATCNNTCSFEGVEVEVNSSSGSSNCGNFTSALWDLRSISLDSRDNIMNAIVNNRSSCDTSRLQEIPTTPQIEALLGSQKSAIQDWVAQNALPKEADFNKVVGERDSLTVRLAEEKKTNEIMQTTFLNATNEKDVVIAELRADKGSINSRYDGALVVILGLVMYTSGILSWIVDKLRGAT